MKLIYEKQDAFILPYLINNIPYTFFKFTAVLASGYHSGKVEHHYTHALHTLRYVSGDYPLGQSFSDSSLADAWLAYKAWIVLRPAAQYLQYTVCLLFPADNRVELSLSSQSRQIPAVLVKVRGCTILPAPACPVVLEGVIDRVIVISHCG